MNDGGPAFPQPIATSDGAIYAASEKGQQYAGMSLRDWFAAQAMAAFTSRSTFGSAQDVARWAYEYADALLAERAKGGA